MRIVPTALPDPVLVEMEPREDDRGFFARVFDRGEFAAAGLESVIDQTNLSYTRVAGTVRGLHWQVAPAEEAKLVRCVRGAVLDVAVDVRPGSPTYLHHVAVELSAANRSSLYVPPGFAHGYQTLQDDTELLYTASRPYSPGTERGMRYDDPALDIRWALEPTVVSDKDRSWPLVDVPG